MLFIDQWLTAYLAVIAAIIGAAGGSFINCLAWRTVHREKITSGRSHCTRCGHLLGVLDLVPVFSWVFLRGRCRYCKGKISPRYLAAELLMAGVSLCLLFRFDVSLPYLYYLGFSFLLLTVGLVDLESFQIPDRFQAALILWWCLFLPTHRGELVPYLADSLAGAVFISGGLLGISMVFDRILGKDSLGGGDIKLFFVTGLYLGAAVNLLNLIVSCLLGLLLGLALSRMANHSENEEYGENKAQSGTEKRDSGQIPFGPAIALSSVLCVLIGRQLTGWYMSLF